MDKKSQFNIEIRIVAPESRGWGYIVDKVVDPDFTNFKDLVDEVVDKCPPSYGDSKIILLMHGYKGQHPNML